MTFIIKVDDEKTVLANFEIEEKKVIVNAITQISTNYSLIRYLLSLLDTNSISINDSGYICMRRKNMKKTSFQQILMDFYMQHEEQLSQYLKHTEIDHINGIKTDNTTKNFQLLTHKNNILKSKKSEYQVTIQNEYIMNIENNIVKTKQYKIDEKYLKRLNGIFKKTVKTGIIEDISKCCYLDLSSRTILKQNQVYQDITESLNNIALYVVNILTENHAKLIINMYKEKKKYICHKILRNNLIILNRFKKRYSYLDEVIKKYNILYDYTKELRVNSIIDYNYQKELFSSNNLLFDLYQLIITDNKYVIKDDNILSSIDISFDFDKRGKYYSFRVMYLLGLLQRLKTTKKKTFLCIPIYTEKTLKEANLRAKKILELDLRKLTYFIVVEEFGEEIAESIFKGRTDLLSKRYKQYSVRAKEDIITLLREDKDLYLQGYIKVEDIYEQIDFINHQRKIHNLEYNPIYKGFNSFISGLLKYNTDTKQALKELGLEYRKASKSIIINIEEYQKRNGLNIPMTTSLKPRQMIIVLNKLTK